jgi:hypothetical protein
LRVLGIYKKEGWKSYRPTDLLRPTFISEACLKFRHVHYQRNTGNNKSRIINPYPFTKIQAYTQFQLKIGTGGGL